MIRRSRASAAARFALVATALFLPTLVLVPLGGLYLWQNGYLLVWAVCSAVSVGSVYVAQKWVFSDTNIPVATAESASSEYGVHPTWSPLEVKAWADVRQIAISADADKITGSEALLALAHQTINTVANRIHPGKDDALWRFTMPEALAITERVSARLSDFIVLNIPFGDRLTVSQVVQVYKWRSVADVAERAYDIWRIVRLSNPATALTHEARERLSRAMLQWGREHVSRRLIETYVEEVGRAAIDLYGGRLRISHQQFLTSDQMAGGAGAAGEFSSREPIVIIVVAQSDAKRRAMTMLLSLMERERSEATLAFLRGEHADARPINQPQLIVHEFNGQPATPKERKALSGPLKIADIVAVVSDGGQPSSSYERDVLQTIATSASVVPPLLLPISMGTPAVAGMRRDPESVKPATQNDWDYDGKFAQVTHLVSGTDANAANMSVLWAALDSLSADVRRIHLLRRVDTSKTPVSWGKQAQQATSALGRLAKSLVQRRR